jgi:hypothetical protein
MPPEREILVRDLTHLISAEDDIEKRKILTRELQRLLKVEGKSAQKPSRN